eukprot:TRINITY_DN25571_c0_g1_i1.p1 TRINITY_DN25571_c0_g1~~TRINITY_DN25571_c0_g1_i1.p1  ORF type:complete len:633 (+),score=106.89 TRINITY_DN25571_c0_g1_i1:136-2034(+)
MESFLVCDSRTEGLSVGFMSDAFRRLHGLTSPIIGKRLDTVLPDELTPGATKAFRRHLLNRKDMTKVPVITYGRGLRSGAPRQPQPRSSSEGTGGTDAGGRLIQYVGVSRAHSKSGWPYCVVVAMDVSEEALPGDDPSSITTGQEEASKRGVMAMLMKPGAAEHFDELAVKMWARDQCGMASKDKLLTRGDTDTRSIASRTTTASGMSVARSVASSARTYSVAAAPEAPVRTAAWSAASSVSVAQAAAPAPTAVPASTLSDDQSRRVTASSGTSNSLPRMFTPADDNEMLSCSSGDDFDSRENLQRSAPRPWNYLCLLEALSTDDEAPQMDRADGRGAAERQAIWNPPRQGARRQKVLPRVLQARARTMHKRIEKESNGTGTTTATGQASAFAVGGSKKRRGRSSLPETPYFILAPFLDNSPCIMCSVAMADILGRTARHIAGKSIESLLFRRGPPEVVQATRELCGCTNEGVGFSPKVFLDNRPLLSRHLTDGELAFLHTAKQSNGSSVDLMIFLKAAEVEDVGYIFGSAWRVNKEQLEQSVNRSSDPLACVLEQITELRSEYSSVLAKYFHYSAPLHRQGEDCDQRDSNSDSSTRIADLQESLAESQERVLELEDELDRMRDRGSRGLLR